MRNYEKVQVTDHVLIGIVCDKCGKTITSDDEMELQECCFIDFIGGFNSIFGDENHITCDLCQHCLYELIGKFCCINGGKLK